MTHSAEHIGAGDVTGKPSEDAGMKTKIPEALAVLDSAISNVLLVSAESVDWADKLRKARAAFSELIEATRNDLAARTGDYDASERIGTQMDLKAALAAVETLK